MSRGKRWLIGKVMEKCILADGLSMWSFSSDTDIDAAQILLQVLE